MVLKMMKINFQKLVFLSVGIYYVVQNALQGRHLWFWWDELTIIESQRLGFRGMFQGHFGNFFPLSRFLFFIEVKILGDNYWIFLVLNSIMAVALSTALIKISNESMGDGFSGLSRQSFAGVVAVIFLFSSGTIYAVQWAFMQQWFIAMLIVVLTSIMASQSSRPFLWLSISILISAGFLSSTTLSASFVGLSIIALRMKEIDASLTTLKKSFLVILWSGSLNLSGYVIANLNPTDANVVIPKKPSLDTALFFKALEDIGLGSILWIYKPFAQFFKTLDELKQVLTSQTNFLNLIKNVFFCGLILIIFFLLFKTYSISKKSGLAALFSLCAIFTFQFQVALRGQGTWLQNNLESRYDPVLLFSSLLFWISILSAFRRGSNSSIKQKSKFSIAVTSLALIAIIANLYLGERRFITASDPYRRAEFIFQTDQLKLCPVINYDIYLESVQKQYQHRLCEIQRQIKE